MTTEPFVLTVTVLLVTVGVFAAALFGVRQWTLRRVRAMKDRFPQALRVEAAALFGQESLGKTQMRGNGVLALLPDQLVFERMAARRDYVIPLAQITGIENPKSYLGKSRAVPLLKVMWRDDAGKTDSIAWQVSGLSDWQAHIEATRGRQTV